MGYITQTIITSAPQVFWGAQMVGVGISPQVIKTTQASDGSSEGFEEMTISLPGGNCTTARQTELEYQDRRKKEQEKQLDEERIRGEE